jgi:hypothetical protein
LTASCQVGFAFRGAKLSENAREDDGKEPRFLIARILVNAPGINPSVNPHKVCGLLNGNRMVGGVSVDMRGVDVAGPLQADLGIGVFLMHIVLARNADRNEAQCKKTNRGGPSRFHFHIFSLSGFNLSPIEYRVNHHAKLFKYNAMLSCLTM